MYGKRAVMIFRTTRFISAGEEVTIDYGSDYFNRFAPCQCDAFNYPHTSELYRRRIYPDGSVSPGGFGTYGSARGERGSNVRGQTAPGPADDEEVDEQDARRRWVEIPRVKEARVEMTPMRVSKTRLRTLKEAAASKVVRRRRSWGEMAYKGGDPDRNLLRRSARIAAMAV